MAPCTANLLPFHAGRGGFEGENGITTFMQTHAFGDVQRNLFPPTSQSREAIRQLHGSRGDCFVHPLCARHGPTERPVSSAFDPSLHRPIPGSVDPTAIPSPSQLLLMAPSSSVLTCILLLITERLRGQGRLAPCHVILPVLCTLVSPFGVFLVSVVVLLTALVPEPPFFPSSPASPRPLSPVALCLPHHTTSTSIGCSCHTTRRALASQPEATSSLSLIHQ